MSNSSIEVSPGSGKVVSTYANTEDGANKETQRVALNDSSGTELGTASNPVRVSSTALTPGTAATNLGKAEDAAHTTGDVGVMMLGVRNENLQSLADTELDYIPQARDRYGRSINFDYATGDAPHDDADTGNPVKIGYKAVAHGANPTAVAAGDRTNAYANRHGIPFMIGGHPNIITLRTNYTSAQTNAALVTVSAGTKIVVTRCSVLADNANTVDVAVRIGFATATTPTGAGTVLSHPGISRGSGVVEGNGAGILGIGADDEDLRITSEVPTGGSIDVMVSYYTIES